MGSDGSSALKGMPAACAAASNAALLALALALELELGRLLDLGGGPALPVGGPALPVTGLPRAFPFPLLSPQ